MPVWMIAPAAALAVAAIFALWRIDRALRRDPRAKPLTDTEAASLATQIAPAVLVRHWSANDGRYHVFTTDDERLAVVAATVRDPLARLFPIGALAVAPRHDATLVLRFRDLGWSPLRLQFTSAAEAAELERLINRSGAIIPQPARAATTALEN